MLTSDPRRLGVSRTSEVGGRHPENIRQAPKVQWNGEWNLTAWEIVCVAKAPLTHRQQGASFSPKATWGRRDLLVYVSPSGSFEPVHLGGKSRLQLKQGSEAGADVEAVEACCSPARSPCLASFLTPPVWTSWALPTAITNQMTHRYTRRPV